ncbi:hypothetical protein [Psychromonas sp.]|uniref:hypothetical protein n=1 Tax=Psychromonas sp. TaxID=1884585 RepID=UPI0035631DAD
MISIVIKAIGIWLVIVIAAIFNGLFREKILTPLIGARFSLPVSGLLLSLLVLSVAFLFIPLLNEQQQSVYFAVGMLWVALTLAFEFLFGHFVLGKSWQEIILVFDFRKGELFVVVLLITAVSPWLAAKARGIL